MSNQTVIFKVMTENINGWQTLTSIHYFVKTETLKINLLQHTEKKNQA